MQDILKKRFDAKVLVTPGCWIWKASTRCNGYGSFKVENNRTVYAHRFSYERHIGEIPEGMHVLHRCDNPSCVNPDHFFLGTHQDNMQDKVRKGRNRNKYTKRLSGYKPHPTSSLNQPLGLPSFRG